MTAAVNLVRPLALGRWPAHGVRDVLLLAALGQQPATCSLWR